MNANARKPTPAIHRPENSVAEIAIELFSRHLLAFELTSVLLFAAAVGAVYLTRREKEPS
jgi:NADH:ubiquinone oxidoreductase subunit 6 (subunit J)